MSDILIKFSTGKPDDDWEHTQSHIPVLGAIVTPPTDYERLYRVKEHVWPAEIVNSTDNGHVTLQVSEIVEAIAEPEPETETENETV